MQCGCGLDLLVVVLTQQVLGAGFPQTAELVVHVDDCQTVYHGQQNHVRSLQLTVRIKTMI